MSTFYVGDDMRVGDDIVVLVAGGEIDYEASPHLRSQIAETIKHGARRLVLDFSAVTFIDSTGVGVLVGTMAKLEEVGGSMAVVCTQENVLRVLEMTGLDRMFSIHSEREAALSTLAPAG